MEEDKVITNLLLDITKFCYEKRIPFNVNMNNGTVNTIAEAVDDHDRVINLELNDIHDENLPKLLTDFFTGFKSAPSSAPC